jgi:hypothetical protein
MITHFEIAYQGIAKGVCVKTVLEDRRRDIRETREDDDTCLSASATLPEK